MSYSDHIERVQRRNARAVSAGRDRFLEPPDGGNGPACPHCGEATENYEEGFVIPGEGYERGSAFACDDCATKCKCCDEPKHEVGDLDAGGWCAACRAEEEKP